MDSLPATDPDRSVLRTLLAFPGVCPIACFTVDDAFDDGSLLDVQLGKGAVKAMLVQSRRYKQLKDDTPDGLPYIDDGPCDSCTEADCGMHYRIPFQLCLHLDGVFDGKCGNSLWYEDTVSGSEGSEDMSD